MKKACYIITMVLMFSAAIHAETTPVKEFTIRGYKIKQSDTPILTIVDALTGSLQEITGGEINVDGYYTLGSASTATADTVSDIAFSYRVSGSCTGSYNVSVTVEPFALRTGGTDGNGDYLTNDNATIDTSYFLINETVRFLNANSSTSDDNFKIENYEPEDSGYVYNKVVRSAKGTLTDGFRITSLGSSTASSADTWIARGAIAFVIDSEDFNAANTQEGTYEADVTVKLEVQ